MELTREWEASEEGREGLRVSERELTMAEVVKASEEGRVSYGCGRSLE